MLLGGPIDIQLRPATSADAPALARLMTAFYETRTTPEQVSARLERSRGLEFPLLALAADRAVGFASLRLLPSLGEDRPYAEISELFVEETYRRQGVARRLVARLEDLAREHSAGTVVVVVNPAAEAFYRAAGYGDYAPALKKVL